MDEPTAPAPTTAAGTPWPTVSVIMPVLNEGRHLRSSVAAVLEQDYPGELEIVLALGPSKDDTDAIATEIVSRNGRVRTVTNPTGRTPNALNAAIAAARHDVIVRVDGHALLPPGYIRTAVRTLEETGADNVGGVMWAEGVTAFEQAVARAMTSPLGVGSARYHVGGEPGPAPSVYLGVFRRQALQRAGGYDESFVRAQDWELNHRIRSTGGLVWFTPELKVRYRPRPTYRALARQYFDYGRWRRVVMRRHAGTANFRYLAPPLLVAGLTAGTALGLAGRRIGFLAPAGYAAALVAGSAVIAGRAPRLPAAAAPHLPGALATMHVSWGLGFLLSPRTLGADEVPPPADAG